jgi:methylglutaconyl-CoA hydratase
MSAVIVERRRGAVLLTLNRPHCHNAFDRALVEQFGEVGEALQQDLDHRAVVVTGQGSRAFCAGADLKERRGMSEDEVRGLILRYRTAFGWLDAHPRPVIAALNGICLGGGLEIALMCDLRVATDSATLGLPETTIAVIPGAGGTQRLPRIVGEAKAKELVLLGTRLSASEGLSLGLVNRVLPSGADFIDQTLDYITPILEGPPVALSAALEAIDAARDLTLEAGLKRESELYEKCLVTDDRREALAAFAEKRRPLFRGR